MSEEKAKRGRPARDITMDTHKSSLVMSVRLRERLSSYCEKHGREVSEVIRSAIDDYLNARGE